MANLPYAQTTGTLEAILEKIKQASVPEKFSQDFVSTKLMMKGGNGRAAIPFIKKMGLVSEDGTPTDRYKQFRNPRKAGAAIADAMREVYAPLFEMNEYVFDLNAADLKALVVEATGAEPSSTVVKKVVSTFQALRNIADFEAKESLDEPEPAESDARQPTADNPPQPIYQQSHSNAASQKEGINLSYTINLNLPATTDVEVFNAIFKSLKQHLLQD